MKYYDVSRLTLGVFAIIAITAITAMMGTSIISVYAAEKTTDDKTTEPITLTIRACGVFPANGVGVKTITSKIWDNGNYRIHTMIDLKYSDPTTGELIAYTHSVQHMQGKLSDSGENFEDLGLVNCLNGAKNSISHFGWHIDKDGNITFRPI